MTRLLKAAFYELDDDSLLTNELQKYLTAKYNFEVFCNKKYLIVGVKLIMIKMHTTEQNTSVTI